MRKVVLYIAMSLDGYIADKEGGTGWLGGQEPDCDDMVSYAEFIETVDTILMGYTTYHQVATQLSPDSWPYSGKKSYVLTHRQLPSSEEIVFTHRGVGELIAQLKAEPGKDIWICGGADIANQLIALDLIDEYCISVIPTILGDGIRLFAKQAVEQKLRLVSTRSYNGITDLVYQRRL